MQSPMPATPESPAPVPGNGAIAQAAQAAAPLVPYLDPAITKRLKAIKRLGEIIEETNRRRDAAETSCSQAESELKSRREKRNNLDHQLEELHDELATLALGKSSERLPFNEPKPKQKAAPGTDDLLQETFDKMTLADIGVKGALADKLDADGIRDGKALREWIQAFPRRDIKGVGKGSVEKMSDLMADKMLALKADAQAAMQRQAKADPEAVPVAQAMGQKPKARKSKARARKG